jgi:hypothetical protein
MARMHDGYGAYDDPALVTPLGKQWRDTINDFAVKTQGVPPQQIFNAFVEHW